jgi:thioredoxin-dependent peroxiredoxin
MNIGEPAPSFDARDDHDHAIKLEDFRGSWLVLYFYPKDNTSGCSLEAGKFEAMLPELQAVGAKVVGVSTDSGESHQKFRAACDLSFPLIADSSKTISKAYGVLGGLTGLLGLADRQTFLIDPDGKIAFHWRRVNPASHALGVKQEIESQQAKRQPVSR